ncbi:hypothetical protein Q0590_26485 [Rhodocytophaga aerolata]|uniref:Uncharacterized protein n=1 Tax=Rhodocytophaga aerolata TaxID=455078 RepID=A0ABT8RCN8_9BACT|nr:hypothetical protein [Rhodocytophaga aerolata]MDO1449855.1 hypothetical protein [Rhodocytophaga aerolata]
MNYIALITGIILLIGTVCDLSYTTFSSNGAGYLTDTLTKGIWRTSLLICGKDGSKKFLEYVGIFTIGAIIIS